MQSIVLLISNCFFQVDLDWFTTAVVHLRRSRWPSIEACRAISYCCTRKSAMYTFRTLDTFEWNAKESLGALSWRNNAVEARFQVDCRLVLPRWSMCAKLRRICFKWSPYSATLTWTSALETLWNRIAVANWPNKSHLLRTWSRSQTLAGIWKNLGTRFPEIELNKGSCWTVIVQNENKDPGNLFTMFIVFFVAIFQSSKIERARKRDSRTKTQWNRAKDFSDPLITLILLPLLS